MSDYDPWDVEHNWRQIALARSILNAATPETCCRARREAVAALEGAGIEELARMREEA